MTTENTRALISVLYLKLKDNHPVVAQQVARTPLTADRIDLAAYLQANGIARYSANMVEYGRIMLIHLTDLVVDKEFNFLKKS